jgi:hypothetical protein
MAAMVLAAILAWTGSALARDPVTGLIDSFFHYPGQPPPQAGNCGAIAAKIGAENTWYGLYGGKRWQRNSHTGWFSAEGCFTSELQCQIWQQQALSFASDVVMTMSCQRGVPASALR